MQAGKDQPFALHLLEHVNTLRDAVGVGIISHHLCREIDKFTGVETPAICIEVIKQLFRSDVCVK